MGETTELYVHVWQANGNWMCGVVNTRKAEEKIPQRQYGYTALSLMPTNVLIHIYWIGGTPTDEIRNQCYGFILAEAERFYREVVE